MKMKVFVIFFLLTAPFGLLAQATTKSPSCLKKVEKLLDNFEYHKALQACNACLDKNSASADVYYQRGLLNYYLNLQHAAAKDFGKALSLGIITEDEEEENFLRWFSDTVFIIQNITDSLTFPTLDPELNYRKKLTRADTLQGMLRDERTCFDVTYEHLTVEIIPKNQSIQGQNEITFDLLEETEVLQFDLYSHYDITEISMDSIPLTYEREFNAIFVYFKEPLQRRNSYSITIKYAGVPRNAPNPPWDGGFVWEKNGDREHIGVACEHLGASAWWPNKDHLSDKPDSMDISIICPTGYDALANGDLVRVEDLKNGTSRSDWHVSYPINNYNVTFYVGDFENFNESYKNNRGENVQIDYYVLAQNLQKAKKYYSKTTRIIEVFEDIFGDYAFAKDGLAFVESPYAGMEHQSAIAIGGDYGKDSVYAMVGDYDRLVIHEAAHEWWGNSVAIGDMADVWINEGFATYSEHLFIEREFGVERYIEFVGDNMFEVSNIWPMVGQRDVNDNAFLGQDVYNKGAAMLHCLRCIYNDDSAFFKMIKEFYNSAKMKISSSKDFVEHAKKYTPNNLGGFFEVFLHQNEPPTLEYSFKHKGKHLDFVYRWKNVPENFEMPFLMVFNGHQGMRVEANTTTKRMSLENVYDFYLYSPSDMDSEIDTKNAFTYYFAEWVNQ